MKMRVLFMLSHTVLPASFVTVLDASFCRLVIPRRLHAELTGTFDARCKSVMQSRKTAQGAPVWWVGIILGRKIYLDPAVKKCCRKSAFRSWDRPTTFSGFFRGPPETRLGAVMRVRYALPYDWCFCERKQHRRIRMPIRTTSILNGDA